MENGFRDKETLTRKDMVFGAVNILATEDKRTLRGVDRLQYVLDTAQKLYDWVQNGRAENGSADQSFECDFCPQRLTIDTAYQWALPEGDVALGCEHCFERLALWDDQEPAVG